MGSKKSKITSLVWVELHLARWCLSHISQGQSNSSFIPGWLLVCARAWFMP